MPGLQTGALALSRMWFSWINYIRQGLRGGLDLRQPRGSAEQGELSHSRPCALLQVCTLTILDDAQYPVIEGLETFVVYLSSPQGAELTKPFQAIVAINDIFQDGKLALLVAWGVGLDDL